MKKISTLLLITLLSSLQLFSSNLENRYSSLSTGLSISTGELDSTSFGISAIGTISEEGKDGLAFLFSFEHMDIDGLDGFDLTDFEIDANAFTYGLGYIFKTESWHIVPYYGFTNVEVGVDGFLRADVDGSAYGLMFRTMISDTSVLTFDISNTDVDDALIDGSSINVSNLTSEATYSLDIENEISDSTSFVYGASFVDGTTSFKFGLSINL